MLKIYRRFRLVSVWGLLLLSDFVCAQEWHLVKEFPQKSFPKTVPAGNYSGITHLDGDLYAVVSDKSDSALFFNFRIQIDSLTGELKRVENLGFTEYVDGSARGEEHWDSRHKGYDHEGIAKVSAQSLVVASEGNLYDLRVFPINPLAEPHHDLWSYSYPAGSFYPNYQLESLTFDADRHLLWTISESTLRKDGKPSTPQNGLPNKLRLLAFDFHQQKKIVASYAYQMDAPSTHKHAEIYVMGVSELCALPDGQILVLEREAFIPKMKLGAFCKCKLYLVNPAKEKQFAFDATFSEDTPFVEKKLVAEWKTDLSLFGRSFANYEGMCLGPKLSNGHQVIILLSDSQNQYAGILKDWFKTIVISQ